MNIILSVEPVRFPLTGIGRYTWELARQLEINPEVNALKLFAGRRFLPALPTASHQSGGGYGLKRAIQNTTLGIEAYRVLMPLVKAQALKGLEDHLYHGPNYYLPPFSGARVATFHDLSPFTWPHCHAPKMVGFLQKELRKTLKVADAPVTDSEFTRRELAQYFNWPLERIHAVPLASSGEFYPRAYEALQPVLARHGVAPGGYCLFVGTIEPRKNIEVLLDAYERLPTPLRTRYPLLLTGYYGWRNDSIHRRLAGAAQEGWARYVGFVPSEELPMLFAGARLFAFPSLYEGFGLPVLEAMASGIPVVCSNSSSLPEVAGGLALLCDPHDVEGLTAQLARGLEDEPWRAHVATAGIEWARGFSWQRCAAETVAVYRQVLGARP